MHELRIQHRRDLRWRGLFNSGDQLVRFNVVMATVPCNIAACVRVRMVEHQGQGLHSEGITCGQWHTPRRRK